MAGLDGAFVPGTYQLITPLNAVASTQTSSTIVMTGAKKVTWFFTRTNHAAGSSTFDVDVSLDGTTFTDFNKLVSNTANTNAQMLTRVASVALSSNTTTVVSMDLQHDTYYAMRVTATRATDGNSTAQCLIEY